MHPATGDDQHVAVDLGGLELLGATLEAGAGALATASLAAQSAVRQRSRSPANAAGGVERLLGRR